MIFFITLISFTSTSELHRKNNNKLKRLKNFSKKHFKSASKMKNNPQQIPQQIMNNQAPNSNNLNQPPIMPNQQAPPVLPNQQNLPNSSNLPNQQNPNQQIPNQQNPNQQTPNQQNPNQQTPNQQNPNQQTSNQQNPNQQTPDKPNKSEQNKPKETQPIIPPIIPDKLEPKKDNNPNENNQPKSDAPPTDYAQIKEKGQKISTLFNFTEGRKIEILSKINQIRKSIIINEIEKPYTPKLLAMYWDDVLRDKARIHATSCPTPSEPFSTEEHRKDNFEIDNEGIHGEIVYFEDVPDELLTENKSKGPVNPELDKFSFINMLNNIEKTVIEGIKKLDSSEKKLLKNVFDSSEVDEKLVKKIPFFKDWLQLIRAKTYRIGCYPSTCEYKFGTSKTDFKIYVCNFNQGLSKGDKLLTFEVANEKATFEPVETNGLYIPIGQATLNDYKTGKPRIKFEKLVRYELVKEGQQQNSSQVPNNGQQNLQQQNSPQLPNNGQQNPQQQNNNQQVQKQKRKGKSKKHKKLKRKRMTII